MLAAAGTGLVHRWAKFYGDRDSVSTTVTFLHLAGMLVAGGLAVAADRASLRLSSAGGTGQTERLDDIASVHRLVIGGLALTFVTGVLMLFSDLDTFLHSWVFWTKMGLIALLLGNGYVRMRAENAIRRGAEAWRRFRQTSIASLVLWFAVVLAGTMLMAS
jgi:hypothetical protein